MNRQQLESIEQKARRAAQNSFDVKAIEDWKGRITSYVIIVDGTIYDSVAAFYEAYPQHA